MKVREAHAVFFLWCSKNKQYSKNELFFPGTLIFGSQKNPDSRQIFFLQFTQKFEFIESIFFTDYIKFGWLLLFKMISVFFFSSGKRKSKLATWNAQSHTFLMRNAHTILVNRHSEIKSSGEKKN